MSIRSLKDKLVVWCNQRGLFRDQSSGGVRGGSIHEAKNLCLFESKFQKTFIIQSARGVLNEGTNDVHRVIPDLNQDFDHHLFTMQLPISKRFLRF